MKRLIFLLSLLISLSACAETGSSLTLEANYNIASTQVQDLRITATVLAARAETTLDFMGTRSARSVVQSVYLEETLIATGYSPDILATQRESIMGTTPTLRPTITLVSDVQGNVISTPAQVSETLTPTAPAVTLNAPEPTLTLAVPPMPDLGGLNTGSLITATGSGNDGCGSGITSVFGMGVNEIYVILPVFNIRADTYTFSAHWKRDGRAIGPVYDFTPDYDSDSLCIWFFVDNTDFSLEPGNYSVRIDINGQAVTGEIPFIIQ